MNFTASASRAEAHVDGRLRGHDGVGGIYGAPRKYGALRKPSNWTGHQWEKPEDDEGTGRA